jgi:hypothetical protein
MLAGKPYGEAKRLSNCSELDEILQIVVEIVID